MFPQPLHYTATPLVLTVCGPRFLFVKPYVYPTITSTCFLFNPQSSVPCYVIPSALTRQANSRSFQHLPLIP
ncbi:hypothetical protein XELAEV_18005798mg [Xenopus laevis]|uniref:Uncharacterized protein n=1 Tax=Xenopus laevis TaxID=8355 RepID=A0A974DYY4_XENLA|nr:hypothetical protein XELAEV_18005798mg [Xenopus laevis]